MENYNEVVLEIEERLIILRKIIEGLEEENARLRKQLNKTEGFPENVISLEYAFLENCYILDESGESSKKTNVVRTITYNVLRRAGCKNLNSLEEKKANDLLQFRHAGIVVVGFIIAVCRHYHIEIELDENLAINKKDALKLAIADWESKLIFKQ